MDAHNLAVVLSPNILPMTLSSDLCLTTDKKNKHGNASILSVTEDNILSANIEILQVRLHLQLYFPE